jgi:transmembrane sensor
MDRDATVQSRIDDEAASWFARLQDSRCDASLREDFAQWLLRSPAHIDGYLSVARAWGDLDVPTDEAHSVERLIADARSEGEPTTVVPFRDTAAGATSGPVERPRWQLRRVPRLAAVLAIAALGSLAYLGARGWTDSSHLKTAVGEQRTLALADGSIVQLNTDSEIDVEFDGRRRRIELLRGEARFEVSKDASRPFVVDTEQASVRALGTIFNVRAGGTGTAVAVIEGRVEVTGHLARETAASADRLPSRRTHLSAGERASVTPTGRVLPNAGPSLEQVMAWTERRLVFRDAPLIDVVSEFNRYERRSIRIVDPVAAALHISGSFATNDLDSLLQYLDRYHSIESRTNGDDGTLMLSRATIR